MACRLASIALLALLVSACATAKPSSAPAQVAPACGPDDWYIPRDTFPRAYPGSDEDRRRWYSTALARMDELSLACGEWSASTAYRFLWLETFSYPVAIRATRYGTGREFDLLAIRLSGIGGGDPGVVLHHVRRPLSAAEWDRLSGAIGRAGFWTMPTSGNMYGLHGEQWVIEGRRSGTYHLVDRWSPRDKTYRDLGLLFFELAGWPFPGAIVK